MLPVKLPTGAEMARIDHATIEGGHVPGAILMERAGRAVAAAIARDLGDLEGRIGLVVAGGGNNGGDGFVVARFLREHGAGAHVHLLVAPDAVRGDAALHLAKARDAGVVVRSVANEDALDPHAWARSYDFAVDAILGTGFSGSPRGLVAKGIEALARIGLPVFAVDVPSGVSAEDGGAPGACVSAKKTVTFGLPKVGHLCQPGRALSGVLVLADIGFPADITEAAEVALEAVSPWEAASWLPARAPDAHKGTCGRVAVIAGSMGLTGAAALASEAALRTGAGLVVLGLPASLNDPMEVKLTEVITRPLPELRRKRCLALRAMGTARELIRWSDAAVLGPGLGRHRETSEVVRRLVASAERPLVVDADGLWALAGRLDVLRDIRVPCVLTPHTGEFDRLVGESAGSSLDERVTSARTFSETYGVVLLLKGAPSLIATPDGDVWVNPTGNAGMATGGTGDVLSGVLGTLLAQGMPADRAAIVASALQGRAGDRARERLGERSLAAGDLVNELAGTFAELEPSPFAWWGAP